MEKLQMLLEYLKALKWPLIIIVFVILYHSEIGNVIKNVYKIHIGPVEAEVKKPVEELENKLDEIIAKSVTPETTYAVVKAFRNFEEAIRQGRKTELGKYFSRHYPNRQEDIKNWSERSKNELSIEVKDLSYYRDKIKASIKGVVKGQEWEDYVILIMEDNTWKFSE